MQYFQNANSKQILGRSAATEDRTFADAVSAETSAGVTVRGTRAIATATSILFMTISF
jgi:hypothetical protein